MDSRIAQRILIIICFVYGIFSIAITQHLFVTSSTPYYNFLIDAFLHKRVNVILPVHSDLSTYHGKWYLNWAPAPILVILPFYLLLGKYASDNLYTLIAGIVNCYLFYYLLQQYKKQFHVSPSCYSELFVLIGFAICSPNFYLSLTGQIWSTEQIIGLFYLLCAYILLFSFLHKGSLYLTP